MSMKKVEMNPVSLGGDISKCLSFFYLFIFFYLPITFTSHNSLKKKNDLLPLIAHSTVHLIGQKYVYTPANNMSHLHFSSLFMEKKEVCFVNF